MKCVILAGGMGTRFWPYSRMNRPKQLLNIFGDKSMLQMTVDRLRKVKKITPPPLPRLTPGTQKILTP